MWNLLFIEVQGMVHSLTSLSGKGYEPLSTVLKSLGRGARDELAADMHKATDSLTLSLDQIQTHHAKDVGAKAANQVLMRNALALPTPDGFSITTAAYRLFLIETGLSAYIDEALAGLAADDPAALEATSREIRAQIMESPLPEAIRIAIDRAVDNLAGGKSFELRLAVRSSAVGEDGEISFAGQYTSVLNVSTENLYLLQVRPLLVISETAEENPELIHEYFNHLVLPRDIHARDVPVRRDYRPEAKCYSSEGGHPYSVFCNGFRRRVASGVDHL